MTDLSWRADDKEAWEAWVCNSPQYAGRGTAQAGRFQHKILQLHQALAAENVFVKMLKFFKELFIQ